MNIPLMTLCSLIRKRRQLIDMMLANELTDYEVAEIEVKQQQIEDLAAAIEGDNMKRKIA